MKLPFLGLFLAFCMIRNTHAQSDTDELLGAPNAKSYIQLWPDFDKKTFLYSLDRDVTRKQYKLLSSCPTVGVPRRQREVALTIRFYNPLQYSIRTTDTLLLDPSFVAISQFASSLTNFIRQLPTIPESPKAANSGTNKLDKSANDPLPLTTETELNSFTVKAAGLFSPESVSITNTKAKSPVDTSLMKSMVITKVKSETLATKTLDIVTNLINDLAFSDLAEWKYAFMQGRLSCIDTATVLIRR
ncbi:hypothetical protein J2I47_00005, partial [Fibrella sp. HMF5335]